MQDRWKKHWHPTKLFDQVLEQLLISGEIKVWKAREILEDLQNKEQKPKGFDIIKVFH
ncbi:MAG: hypothetical protein Ct9H300mP4_17800 [Gammaproteobacteria bacterium]|nr:MAG: hypothetical protein Ct9H300mP4_17800 [Gammaproteobacteria bacterium]